MANVQQKTSPCGPEGGGAENPAWLLCSRTGRGPQDGEEDRAERCCSRQQVGTPRAALPHPTPVCSRHWPVPLKGKVLGKVTLSTDPAPVRDHPCRELLERTQPQGCPLPAAGAYMRLADLPNTLPAQRLTTCRKLAPCGTQGSLRRLWKN